MKLFLVLGFMTLAAIAFLLAPLLRRRHEAEPRAAYDLAIYRDQLRELERDRERGLIDEQQHANARIEIERRMLAATPAETTPQGPSGGAGRATWLAAIACIALVPLAAGALYLTLGSPGLPDRPLAAREQRGDQPAHPEEVDIAGMVERLAARLEENPDNLEGWLMLGRSYLVMERYDEAVQAMARAVEVSGGRPDIRAAYGEFLVFAAGGTVTPKAKEVFADVLADDPGQPVARFYRGLGQIQAGEREQGLDTWIALAESTPPDAPWLGALRERIADTARQADLDAEEILAALPEPAPPPEAAPAPEQAAPSGGAAPPGTGGAPGPTQEQMEQAAEIPPAQRERMIRGMVDRLAARLEDNPDDLEGWTRLGRSYRVLGERERSREAFARAAELAPRRPEVLEAYGESIVAAAPDDAPVPPEAVSVFERLAEIDADNPLALWTLGRAEAERGNAAEARTLWRRLLDALPPDDPRRPTVERALDGLERDAAP